MYLSCYIKSRIKNFFLEQQFCVRLGFLFHFYIVSANLRVGFFHFGNTKKSTSNSWLFERNMERTSLLSLLMFCLTSSVSASRLELTWDRS